MKVDNTRYLKSKKYSDKIYGVDFESPSVGMTLKLFMMLIKLLNILTI